MRELFEVHFEGQDAAFVVRHARVQSAMSSPFSITLTVHSEHDDADLDAIVGSGAKVGVRVSNGLTGPTRLGWTGVCISAELVAIASAGVATYAFTIAPELWRLSQRRNYRIFQRKNALDIVKAMLDEWSLPYASEVDASSLPKLDYRVQYGESDLGFVSRILEEAGISYYFRFQDDRSQIFLTDRPATATRTGEPIPFHAGMESEEPQVSHVYRATSARYGSLVVRDRDFRKPNLEVKVSAASTAGSTSAIEVFEYMPGQSLTVGDASSDAPIADAGGGVRADLRALGAYAQRRIDGHRASHRRITFSTNVLDVAPGIVTAIVEHPRSDLGADKGLLVVSTVLEGEETAGFRVLVHAVLAEAPFRPVPSTPKPAALGLMTATVVGPAGEEIHTDEFGRVRVQFPWDRYGKLDEHSSCWIRVSQGWAGTGYGMMAVPRVGQEVLVSFLAGDPDQPVVVGRLYNAAQQVPYKLPDQKAVSGWKTNSTPGSSGFNELRFDDRSARELLYMQAQRDLQKLVKHDEREQTINDRSISVGGNLTVSVDGDQTETTKGNFSVLVEGTRKEHHKSDITYLVDGSMQTTIKKALDYVVGGVAKWLLSADRHLHVSKNDMVQVDGGKSTTVGGDDQRKVGGKWAVDATGEVHIKGGGKIVIEAGSQVTLKGPGGFVDVGPAGVTIVGTLVKINSGGSGASGSGSSPASPDKAGEAPPVSGGGGQGDDGGDGGPPSSGGGSPDSASPPSSGSGGSSAWGSTTGTTQDPSSSSSSGPASDPGGGGGGGSSSSDGGSGPASSSSPGNVSSTGGSQDPGSQQSSGPSNDPGGGGSGGNVSSTGGSQDPGAQQTSGPSNDPGGGGSGGNVSSTGANQDPGAQQTSGPGGGGSGGNVSSTGGSQDPGSQQSSGPSNDPGGGGSGGNVSSTGSNQDPGSQQTSGPGGGGSGGNVSSTGGSQDPGSQQSSGPSNDPGGGGSGGNVSSTGGNQDPGAQQTSGPGGGGSGGNVSSTGGNQTSRPGGGGSGGNVSSTGGNQDPGAQQTSGPGGGGSGGNVSSTGGNQDPGAQQTSGPGGGGGSGGNVSSTGGSSQNQSPGGGTGSGSPGNTPSATEGFQKDHGPSPTGNLDEQTSETLKKSR